MADRIMAELYARYFPLVRATMRLETARDQARMRRAIAQQMVHDYASHVTKAQAGPGR